MVRKPGTRRNQPPYHHVFLQTSQVIAFTGHRSFRQHSRGLLEGSRRNERLRCKRRLGDTQQYTPECRKFFAFRFEGFVDGGDPGVLQLFTPDQIRLSGPHDLRLTQHLPDNDLDMFVIDGHTL